jgi:AcrR family transcriptional regulator
MKAVTTKQPPKKHLGGRPREFEEDDALDRAMRLFWRKGYEGASLAELTEAMGINPPTLYRTFGNKEKLFWKALERYGEGPAIYVGECLNEPTALEVVKARLYGAVAAMTDPEHPWGCLGVQAAVTCGEAGAPIREGLIKVRAGTEAGLRERFQRAIKEGDLPAACDPAALAFYFSTLVLGISVQAASGVSRKVLLKFVEDTLNAWPSLTMSTSSAGRSL